MTTGAKAVNRRALLLACLAGVAAGVAPAQADRASHDEARRALERGEIRPLAEILQKVQAELGGEVIGIELERDDGSWIYELRIIDREGRRKKAIVDAASGAIRRVRTREN